MASRTLATERADALEALQVAEHPEDAMSLALMGLGFRVQFRALGFRAYFWA